MDKNRDTESLDSSDWTSVSISKGDGSNDVRIYVGGDWFEDEDGTSFPIEIKDPKRRTWQRRKIDCDAPGQITTTGFPSISPSSISKCPVCGGNSMTRWQGADNKWTCSLCGAMRSSV